VETKLRRQSLVNEPFIRNSMAVTKYTTNRLREHFIHCTGI